MLTAEEKKCTLLGVGKGPDSVLLYLPFVIVPDLTWEMLWNKSILIRRPQRKLQLFSFRLHLKLKLPAAFESDLVAAVDWT